MFFVGLFEACSTSLTDRHSPYAIPIETLQGTFPNLSSAVLSSDDIPMDIFKRNALIKRNILDSKNITIRTGFEVSRISKNDNFFKIFDKDGNAYDKVFDQVILTAWDQTKNILQASFNADSELPSALGGEPAAALGDAPTLILDHSPAPPIDCSEFTVEDRVLALCDIRHLQPQQKTPIMTLTGGGMFIPLNDDLALACRCIKGATYPKDGKQEIDSSEILEHGQRIIEELEVILGNGHGVKLLGARYQHIVRRAETELTTRLYEPPIIPQNGIIAAIPPKATFIASLALQVVEKVLLNLPAVNSKLKVHQMAE